jgi:hypothetical protein
VHGKLIEDFKVQELLTQELLKISMKIFTSFGGFKPKIEVGLALFQQNHLTT